MSALDRIADTHARVLRAWRAGGERGPRPRMPEQLAEKVCDLVARVSSRRNWARYSYVEDMQSRALVAIVSYSHSYDATKGKYESWCLRCAWTWMTKELNRERKQDNIRDEFQRQAPPTWTGPPPPARREYLRERDAKRSLDEQYAEPCSEHREQPGGCMEVEA